MKHERGKSMEAKKKGSAIIKTIGLVAAIIVVTGSLTFTVLSLYDMRKAAKEEIVEDTRTAEQETAKNEKNEKNEKKSSAEKETAPAPTAEKTQETIGKEDSAEQETEVKEEKAAPEPEPQTAVQTAPPVQPVQTNTVKYETCYVVNCRESITLRTSPSTGAGEYCQIPFGASVSYVETAENGFYKIIYNGQTGYGLASYLSFDAADVQKGPKRDSYTANTYTQSYTTTMTVINCNESITLRTRPSTSAGEYCQIPLGASVEYLGEAGNGFYQVAYGGYTGYALASYLYDYGSAGSTSAYMRVVNCKESITLRKFPSTDADQFCQIPLGATVEYLGTAENDFYMISYNGYTGYSLSYYLAW